MTILEAIAIDLRNLEAEYIFELENVDNKDLFVHGLVPARKLLLQAVQLRDAYQRSNISFAPFISSPPTQSISSWPPAAPPVATIKVGHGG